jgi:tetratricopeptide (TPR) repeat protein
MAEAEQTYRQAAALPGRQFKDVHALFMFQQGKRDAALAELEKISRDAPDDRPARNRLVTAYVSMGKNQAALDLLISVLKKNPKDTDALFQKGGILFRTGNLAEADNDLRGVLRFKPDMAEAHIAMADVDKAKGLPMMARQELTQALRINPALLPARLKLARSFTQAKEPKSALDVLNAAAPAQKNTLALVAERNWALLAAGQIKEARSDLVQALRVRRFPDLVVQDALARLDAADYAGAAADAEETIRNNPEDVRGLRLLADSYLAQKQPAKAEARLKEAVAAHPQSAPLANLLGNWYLNSNNFPEARKAFDAALMADPKSGPAMLALAALDSQEKHYDAARKRLAGMVTADPSTVPAVMMLAGIAGETGDQEESVRRYRAVLVLDSSNVMALNGLAYALIASEPDEALKYAQRASELAPNNAAIADTLGWAYYRKAIYPTAETYLESAVTKDPSPRREFHLALCYLKTGKRDLGTKTLQMALQKDPSLAASEKGW